MYKDFDITKTKLIIWDLDDTFWSGTLSEGGVNFIDKNLSLLEELTTRGIMNSICSKNDFLHVKTEFVINGYIKYWQMFVFASINWSSKGQRVKKIIESMQLREENVIIIDDSETNIKEVKFYCPNIMSASPDMISKIADELYMVNDYDFEHTRLKQYKILETKYREKLLSESSNEDFLRSSDIKVCIKHNCIENIDRIYKLVLRTNQLNFTKNRIDKSVLANIFAKPDLYNSAYIVAEDKYGNYGICGFYALNKEKNVLEHFLFSCRIMNMGIEQYIYKYLGEPAISIKPPVSSKLNSVSDWIELVDNIEIKQKKENVGQKNLNILFKGACDLYSAINYIDGDCNIDTEFPYWNKNLVYISSHTHPAFIEQTHRLSSDEIKALTLSFPYPQQEEFHSEFFNPKYKFIILSLLQVSLRGIYINKNNGHYIEYGYINCDLTNEENWDKILSSIPEDLKEQNKKILSELKNEYTFAGNPPIDLLIQNLKYIIEHLSPSTNLILILGSEIETNKLLKGYEAACDNNKLVNESVRKFVTEYKNIDIIEISELITSDDDYTECINHFSRTIYAKIAKKIVDIVNSKLDKKILILKTEKEEELISNVF